MHDNENVACEIPRLSLLSLIVGTSTLRIAGFFCSCWISKATDALLPAFPEIDTAPELIVKPDITTSLGTFFSR